MQIRRKLQYENVEVPPSESFAAREFHQENFTFSWHYHPEIELTLIVRGHGMRFVGDSVEHYVEGDVCLLGANLPHTWSSDPAEGRVHSFVLQFRPDFWGGAFDALPEVQPVRKLIQRSSVGLALGGAMRQRVAAWMRELFNCPAGSAARVALLLRMLGELAHATPRELRPLAASAVPAAPTDDGHADEVIATILRRLNAAPSQPPKQSELAALAGVSAPVLSRLFKRRVGTTYPEYINGWRIARVCQDLANTDRSITDIALDVGYGNLSNFNRRFKQAKGMTPRAYRRLARAYE